MVGIGLAFGLFLAGLAPPAWAQRVDIETGVPKPAEPRFEVIPPDLHDQVTRPPDADFYPDGPRVRHDPAFIEPFAVETERGWAGLSGWTAPQTPVGPEAGGRREVTGWLAVGFSFTWGGPPPPPAARRPAMAR